MKILYHFRTQGTGAEGVHIAGIAGAFEKLGHAVVFSSPGRVDPRPGASPFRSAEQRGLLARLAAHAPGFVFELLEVTYNLVALLRHRALLARESFDLIYERHAFFLCSTAWLAEWRGIPLVVEVNELAGDERVRAKPWLTPLARLSDRFTFERARLIVVVSPHLQRRIVAMGIAPEKVLVLPNAVSEAMLDAPADAAAVRARYDCEAAVVIGFVGWFVPWHRLDQLVAEFAALAKHHPTARLMLVGDGDLKPALAAQAAQLGVADQVVFTSAVPHSEIADYVAAMDIAVVPHSNEYRSPIKLFEYMARGRAVLAPRVEPIESIICDGENGLLFEPSDPADLRRQLVCLIESASLRAWLGTCARETVRTRHTWTKNAEIVLQKLSL